MLDKQTMRIFIDNDAHYNELIKYKDDIVLSLIKLGFTVNVTTLGGSKLNKDTGENYLVKEEYTITYSKEV